MLRGSSALIRVLACVLPLLLLCCSKAGDTSAAAPGGYYDDGDYGDGGGYGGGYGGGDYAEAEMMVEEDYAPEPEPMAEREYSKRRETNAQPQSTTTATTESGEGRIEVEAPELEDTPAPAAQARQIIYTATMQVSVYNLENALEIAESLPTRYGGWMHQRVDNQLVLRIPAEHLEAAMATIAELGVVEVRRLEALDVTAQYTDLESRIRVLAQMQAHLQELLKRAKTVEQSLEIRRVLDEITLELEAARAQMRELAKSIAFSTLILRFVERGPTQDLPNHNDPFPWVDELGVEATDYR